MKFYPFFINGEAFTIEIGMILGIVPLVAYALVETNRGAKLRRWVCFLMMLFLLPILGSIVFNTFTQVAYHPEVSYWKAFFQSLYAFLSPRYLYFAWFDTGRFAAIVAVVACVSAYVGNLCSAWRVS